MGATIEALQRLQEIELQILEVRHRIDRRHRAVEKQQALIAETERRIADEEGRLRKLQIESDQLDLDMKSREEHISKLRQNLNTAKTNKEYSAILTELNTNKADTSKIEERALTLLNEIEKKRAEVDALREERGKEVEKLEELRAQAKSTEQKSQARLDSLQNERDQAAEAVPPRALEFFDRVARKHDGEALAPIMRTHPKREEYACEGCNMAVTLEQVNSILSRDEPVTCNVCGRILYFETHATSGTR